MVPEERKWVRICDSLSAVALGCASVLVLVFFGVSPETTSSPYLVKLICALFLISSPILFRLLYRNSDILKLERFFIVIVMVISAISVLNNAIQLYK